MAQKKFKPVKEILNEYYGRKLGEYLLSQNYAVKSNVNGKRKNSNENFNIHDISHLAKKIKSVDAAGEYELENVNIA